MARRLSGIFSILFLLTQTCAAQNRITTAARQQQQPQLTPQQPMGTGGLNLLNLESDAIMWLQGLIRINTTNPPGNELAAAKYLSDILQKEGISPEIFESTPGRGILVARLSATAVPNPSRALLLMGHLDVVGVDKSKWKVDPFSGVIDGSYLYGRGAIDDKGMTVAAVAVMVALKRSNARLDRDVILLCEGDEEAGGENGMKFAVEKHWDKIAAGFAINEGGRVVMKDGKVQYVGIQASEKLPQTIDVVATGTSGHASVPRKDDPVTHLAAAIAKIGTFQTPVQFNSVTSAYFEGLAKVEDDETSKWMRALDEGDRSEHAARWISDADPSWNSMLRDTIAPTMLQAGISPNVVPGEARGVVNIRLLPGNLLQPLLTKLEQAVSDPAVRLEPRQAIRPPAPSSSVTSELYNAISATAQREFPGAAVIPYMSTGATDSAFLRVRQVEAYGLLPFPISEDDAMRMHADNERIQIDSFRKGLEFLYHVVNDFTLSK